jgi:hypothetical protein
VLAYNLEKNDWTTSSLSVVVLGASGDLAKKKIFPALFSLYYEGLLPEVCSECAVGFMKYAQLLLCHVLLLTVMHEGSSAFDLVLAAAVTAGAVLRRWWVPDSCEHLSGSCVIGALSCLGPPAYTSASAHQQLSSQLP